MERGGGAGGRGRWGGMGFDWGGRCGVVGEMGSCIRWDEFMILRNEVTAYESLVSFLNRLV